MPGLARRTMRQSPMMHLFQVLAILLSLVSSVLAQGKVGGNQSSCSAAQAFVYRGCYSTSDTGRHLNFNWQLTSDPTNEKYYPYPGYTSANNMTIELCVTACRGHGWRYAALFNGNECYCASAFPNPNLPTSGSTANGVGLPTGNNPSSSTTANICNSPCLGNSSEYCGGSGASFYSDPSFTNNVATDGAMTNFQYLGCFSNANPGPVYTSLKTPNTTACLAYCGALGYAFSSRSAPDTNTGATSCGELNTESLAIEIY